MPGDKSETMPESLPRLDLHRPRSSSVIVHLIPPASRDAFLEWQSGVTAQAQKFPGYQATDVYPPDAARPNEWVIILHFDDSQHLQAWIDSPERAEWTAKLTGAIGTYRLQSLSSGFAAWFDDKAEAGSLPHWKVFLLVLVGLYPTVMIITLLISPHIPRWGLAVSILIGNVLSCVFLEWIGSPMIRFMLGSWLKASGREGRRRNILGTLAIVLALVVMAVVFHLIAG